ncbi:MAG: helix-turn-helix domain-containing protein [Lachnospiraceae bacterium]|nr:helix-turn-helix domain-containing protein [Lachnospiraceae bacterium]
MEEKLLMSAEEVAELLQCSKAHAYKIIRKLNEELGAKGYIVITGKVSTKYLKEKFYGIA